jgi:2-keto-4-pentenoate hydratase/2-oxohepta-3-ene-1,7-dioic acid hydratase in catechol pathway
MRLANLDGRATLLTGAGALDVERGSNGRFGAELPLVYEQWHEFMSTEWDLGRAEPLSESLSDSPRLGPPSPAPRQVFAIGLNYRDHVAETGADLPAEPAVFTKFQSSLAPPFGEVTLPSPNVDWEVELVVVIGSGGRSIAEESGWAAVAGLTVGQDLSERVVQRAAGSHFSLGKSFPGFAPIGPWLVTPDEFEDPGNLALSCSVDGEVRQNSRTSNLVFDVPALIAKLSVVVTLWPGDLIFTGTPSGVGMARQPPVFLRPGQVLESTIEGIGTIKQVLAAPPR